MYLRSPDNSNTSNITTILFPTRTQKLQKGMTSNNTTTTRTEKAVATVRYSEFKDGHSTTTTTKLEEEKNTTSFLSRALFFWFDKFVLTGRNRDVSRQNFWTLDPEYRAYTVTDQWRYHEKYHSKPPLKSSKITLTYIWRLCRSHVLFSGFMELLRVAFLLLTPQILKRLLSVLQNVNESKWAGVEYCIVLVAVGVLGAICETHTYFQLNNAGIKMKTALISAIYRKSLKMLQPNESDVMNLVSVDCPNLQKALRFIHFPWSCPLQICISLWCMYEILKAAMLPGMVMLILICLFSVTLTVNMKKFQFEQLMAKDQRLGKIVEAVSHLKIIKLHVWEEPFQHQVDELRQQELTSIRMFLTLQAMQNFIWNCAVFCVAFTSFSTYSLFISESLSVETTFVSLALLNALRGSFRLMPSCVASFSQASISIDRIDSFLQSEDGLYPRDLVTANGNQAETEEDKKKYALLLRDCSFARNPKIPVTLSFKATSLSQISLAIKRGDLVGIVGGMASGKSTLMSALCGEIKRTKGSFQMFEKSVYVPNRPWLKSGSIRDNILFGHSNTNHVSYRSKLYEKVIRECGLVEDLQRLPDGDLTWVKKNGDNLSGGQRQRISLARAVFKNAGIYLLDDPMSAIDPCLRVRIFDQVIGNQGLLRKKTRIIITKDQRFLSKLDYIIVMKNQTIHDSGTFDELCQRQSITAESIYGDEYEDVNSDVDSPSDSGHNSAPECENQQSNNQRPKLSKRQQSVMQYMADQQSIDDDPVAVLSAYTNNGKAGSFRRTSSIAAACPAKVVCNGNNGGAPAGHFDTLDDLPCEKVSPDVYVYYLKALGTSSVSAALLLYVFYQVFEIGSKLWLSAWATSREKHTDYNIVDEDLSTTDYITVYGIFGLFQSITFVAGIMTMNRRTLSASLHLHQSIFHRVLHSTIDFIWTTPVGQIANRFSKDMDETDVTLPNTLKNFINQFLRIMGTLIIVTYTLPKIIFTIVPLTIAVLWVLKTYLNTSRMLRRSASATMALVNGHISETILGVSTVRAYRIQTQMTDECLQSIDDHQTFYYMEMVSDCWLFLRLQLLTSIFIGVLSFATVMYKDSMGANLAGLSLTSAITVMQDVFLFARYAAALEKAMVSVERIKEYEDIIQENAKILHTDDMPDEVVSGNQQVSLTNNGLIEFIQVTARYPLRFDSILKKITFEVLPGQHVAVVGRTGSGKSSLVMSLFRMLETVDGCVKIDGEDVSNLPLSTHRSRLNIIPQEAALFSGTLRFNLDPLDKYSDEAIWHCIHSTKLTDYLSKMANGLNTIIETDGLGLSNGEKQVITCIRGLLNDSKIVILDEATSHLGARLNDKVDRAFRSRFKDSTVMIITHNIEKTLNCDKILVLDGGKLKEFDTPENLLANPSSLFYSMATDSGLVN